TSSAASASPGNDRQKYPKSRCGTGLTPGSSLYDPASGWRQHARCTGHSHNAASFPPGTRCPRYTGKCQRRTYSGSALVLSSVRDIQILRSHRSGKTTLMRGDFRFATALVSKEFHLLFFPDGIQCLWGVVTGFIRNFFRHFLTVNRGVSQFHQQIEQDCIAALTLLETRAEQRQNGSNVL